MKLIDSNVFCINKFFSCIKFILLPILFFFTINSYLKIYFVLEIPINYHLSIGTPLHDEAKYHVSIGIPLYNEFKYLEKAILCALNQTLPNVQIVICDDYSTDGSYELALQYANKYSNIKLFRLPKNMGTYVSRREVAYHSDGEYVFEFDPDDLISPYLCEIDYKFAIKTKADIITHDVFNFHEGNYIPIYEYISGPNYTITYPNSTYIQSNFKSSKIGSDLKSKFIKRSVLIEGFKLIDQNLPDNFILYAEDRLISGGIYQKANLMIHLPCYLYFYRFKNYDTSYQRAARKGVHRQISIVNKRLNEIYKTNIIYAS